MNETFQLPDGTVVRTGCLVPRTTASSFPAYASVGPMFTRDELRKMAKRGSETFDASWNKNQLDHGSCNGFAGASALAKSRYRRGQKRVDLSGAYLYSLINGGRDQGSLLEDGMRELANRGCATEATVNWDQIYPIRYDKAKADAEAQQYKALECYVLARQDEPELEVFSALAANFDIIVAVHVTNNFSRLDGEAICGDGNGPGNHAVHCDGYWVRDNGELVADMDNSWGTSFGKNGRGGLTFAKHLRYTMNYHTFYAIRSTTDAKGGKQPPVAQV